VRTSLLFIAIVAIASIAAWLPAGAQTAEIVSTYTSTAEKDCKTAPQPKGEPDDGFSRVCPGMAGLIVVNAEGDLRQVVSVGRTRAAAGKEPAAQAWFGPFNSTTPTIEWRQPKPTMPVPTTVRATCRCWW
jgi:hypothetical protein